MSDVAHNCKEQRAEFLLILNLFHFHVKYITVKITVGSWDCFSFFDIYWIVSILGKAHSAASKIWSEMLS